MRVLLLSGFLGSGKTTLLNRILQEAKREGSDVKAAVILNEFAEEFAVNNELISLTDEEKHHHLKEIFEFGNSCICCTSSSFLADAITSVLQKDVNLLIIEPTGRADPQPILEVISTVATDSILNVKVVTVVDAKYISKNLSLFGSQTLHLQQQQPVVIKNEALNQIFYADLILLNKTDLIPADERTETLKQVRQQLSSINSTSAVVETERCAVDVAQLLRIFEDTKSDNSNSDADNAGSQFAIHDSSIITVSLYFDGEIELPVLMNWLQSVVDSSENEQDVIRMKGIFAVSGIDEKVIIQGAHQTIEYSRHSTKWTGSRSCTLIVIGRNLSNVYKSWKDLTAKISL